MKQEITINLNSKTFKTDICGRVVTDQELVRLLIERDNSTTKEFFWIKCRPLLTSIIYKIFNHKINAEDDVTKDAYYNEAVNIIYEYLMKPGRNKDDAHNLKTFHFQGSLFSWIRKLISHLLQNKKSFVIENVSTETPLLLEGKTDIISEEGNEAKERVDKILTSMLYDDLNKRKKGKELEAAKRRIEIIHMILINEEEPRIVAKKLGINVSNLYNLKRRAIADFARAALKERN